MRAVTEHGQHSTHALTTLPSTHLHPTYYQQHLIQTIPINLPCNVLDPYIWFPSSNLNPPSGSPTNWLDVKIDWLHASINCLAVQYILHHETMAQVNAQILVDLHQLVQIMPKCSPNTYTLPHHPQIHKNLQNTDTEQTPSNSWMQLWITVDRFRTLPLMPAATALNHATNPALQYCALHFQNPPITPHLLNKQTLYKITASTICSINSSPVYQMTCQTKDMCCPQ